MEEDIEKTKEAEIINQPEKKNKKLRIFVISFAVFLVVLIAMLVIHGINPNFSLGWALGIPGGLLAFGGIIYGILALVNRFKSKPPELDKIPPAATPEEVENYIRRYFAEKRENHVKSLTAKMSDNPGKNEIYVYEIELLYPFKQGDESSRRVYVIANANYLKGKALLIESIDSTSKVLANRMNRHSTNPEPGDIIETEHVRNEALGMETIRKKRTPTSQRNKKKQEPEVP